MKRLAAVLALLALSACDAQFEGEELTNPQPSPCEPIKFEGSAFTLCTADPNRHLISTDLSAPDAEEPYRSFEAFAEDNGDRLAMIAMVMNGGMFDEDGQPVGYYVEDGLRLNVLNESEGANGSEGDGNFHMLPNGIFYGDSDGPWRVSETRAFLGDSTERPTFATQSGPMLVIGGSLHPDIDHDGQSRFIRNAVGVDASGRALFVISDAPVSFGKLARLYRDVLNAENALYLDGAISQLWDPQNGRLDDAGELGPLIVVENRAEAGS